MADDETPLEQLIRVQSQQEMKPGMDPNVLDVDKLFNGEHTDQAEATRVLHKSLGRKRNQAQSATLARMSARLRVDEESGRPPWWHELYIVLSIMFIFTLSAVELATNRGVGPIVSLVCLFIAFILLFVWSYLKLADSEQRVYGLFGVVVILLDAAILFYLCIFVQRAADGTCRETAGLEIFVVILLVLNPIVTFLHSFINEIRSDRGTSLGLSSYLHFVVSGSITIPIVLIVTAAADASPLAKAMVCVPLIQGSLLSIVLVSTICGNVSTVMEKDKQIMQFSQAEDDFKRARELPSDGIRRSTDAVHREITKKDREQQALNGVPALFVCLMSIVPIIWPPILNAAVIKNTDDLDILCYKDPVFTVWIVFNVAPLALLLLWDLPLVKQYWCPAAPKKLKSVASLKW